MEILKLIKSNIVYYYTAGIVFVLLMIVSLYIYPADSTGYSTLNLQIIVPAVSTLMGLLAGRAKSYGKWGFPIYIALLTFCLSVLLYGYEDWVIFALGFTSSLIGTVIGHIISSRKKTK